VSKSQIDIISELLLQYSAGNYSYQGEISDHVNEYDMIISGINMLGEELKETTVSNDFFSSIFNGVTDLIVITDQSGKIIQMNKSAIDSLGIADGNYNLSSFDDLIEGKGVFDMIKEELQTKEEFSTQISFSGETSIKHGETSATKILNRSRKFNGYLITITDITGKIENEKLILKTIFSTQQTEQKRVADNLHDSLGQELSMTKLMISNLRNHATHNEKCLELIATCESMLDTSISNLRSICYNLMPGVLKRGGVSLALRDLAEKLDKQGEFNVVFDCSPSINRMDSDLEIVIFRIAQEFISNMIKHSSADKLTIALGLDEKENKISLLLKENGQGFDLQKSELLRGGRGIQNIQSKTKAFNGELDIKSQIGIGTSLHVKFPIIPHYEED
jgi:PAS domain S-box-containing protein